MGSSRNLIVVRDDRGTPADMGHACPERGARVRALLSPPVRPVTLPERDTPVVGVHTWRPYR